MDTLEKIVKFCRCHDCFGCKVNEVQGGCKVLQVTRDTPSEWNVRELRRIEEVMDEQMFCEKFEELERRRNAGVH